MDFNEILAKNLKKELQKRNISMKKLHEMSGVSYKTIRNILNCKIKALRVSYILKIVDVLDINLDELAGRKRKI